MPTSKDIFVMAETDSQGKPKRLSLELAGKAAELAAQTGGRAVGVVCGPATAAATLGEYGLSHVFYCPDPRCADELIGPPAAVLASLIQAHTPWLVLLPGSPLGKDWAGPRGRQTGAWCRGQCHRSDAGRRQSPGDHPRL